MNFTKMTVKVENGCTFVFVNKGQYIGVRGYDQMGKLIFPTCEVIDFNQPIVGEKLKFSYDAGIAIDEFATSTCIATIDIE